MPAEATKTSRSDPASPPGWEPGSGTIVLAAARPDAARAWAERAGWSQSRLIRRADLIASRGRLPAPAPGRALVHSADWSRQAAPQVLLAGLARAGVREAAILDAATGTTRTLGRGRLIAALAALPLSAAAAGAAAAGSLAGVLRETPRTPVAASVGSAAGAVLAIWHGSPDAGVGGSVTHISGILAALRDRGFRTGVVTAVEPPPQLRAVADELELTEPVAAVRRLTPALAMLSSNAAIAAAARRLAARLEPDFVYQRHDRWLSSGPGVAAALGIPFVLEWNGSLVWTERHWGRRSGPSLRALAEVERRVLAASSLVAAVSEPAATMAREEGAEPAAVLLAANAVDPDRVLAAARGAEPADPATGGRSSDPATSGRPGEPATGVVGWVGSFGPWHGAELLVRAIAECGPGVSAVLIGDGPGRAGCERLVAGLGEDARGRITFTGALAHERALATLGRCSALAIPTLALAAGQPFFGSPTKLFEFMALGELGIPIVATPIGQVADLLEDGRTAYLSDASAAAQGNASGGEEAGRAFAVAIRRALADPEAAAIVGRAAAAEVRARHTWDLRARHLLERLGADADGERAGSAGTGESDNATPAAEGRG